MRSSIGKCGTSINNDPPSFSLWVGSSLSTDANKLSAGVNGKTAAIDSDQPNNTRGSFFGMVGRTLGL